MDEEHLNIGSTIDKLKLRKERKEFIAYIIWFYILFGGAIEAIKYSSQSLTEVGTYNIGQLLGGFILFLSVVCAVAGMIALRRITKIVYKKPKKYFFIYLGYILLGLAFMGLFSILAFYFVWSDAKKLLISKIDE